MARIKSNLSLILGFFGIVIIATVVHLLFSNVKFMSGFFWGLTLSYCGLLLFTFLPNFKFNDGYQKLSIIEYLLRSTVRMGTLIILFGIMVFFLKVNALGLLAGSFVGMIGLSFIFLFQMKPSQ